MKANIVDLRKCKPGQPLETVSGQTVIYVSNKSGNPNWPHIVRFPDGGQGSRTDDGFVFSNPKVRLPADENIVRILPRVKPKIDPAPAKTALGWLLASDETPEEKIRMAILALRKYKFNESRPLIRRR